MAEFDLLVSGGRSAAGDPLDIGAVDGRIAALGPDLASGGARERIDAEGLVVLPGAIDPHVHFNEPGPRAGSEGWDTGSAALAAGGATACIEMPFNASPATTSVAAFDVKLAAIGGRSRVDFALWGGIIPGNRGELAGLAARGVAGFKAFMAFTGLDDFPMADDLTLYEGMVEAGSLGLPVAVHAENDAITRGLAARAVAEGRQAVRDYLASRPAIAETEAIARAIELAAAAGCRLHIVHVSTGRGVALVAEARARGVEVTCEVTAHHLVLTDDDAERLGAVAKCAPPLRPAAEAEAMWAGLRSGEVAFVVSDHSPALPAARAGDPFSSWGGIAGCQSTLELVAGDGRLPLAELPRVTAGAAAGLYGLHGKGALAPGADADLALVRLGEERTLGAEELRSRHRVSPYVGRRLTARVTCTILRGAPVYRDGRLLGEPRGRLLAPARGG